MKKTSINGNLYDIQLMVFDKDGLMFESKHFWKELVRGRAEGLLRVLERENIPPTFVEDWLRFFDTSFVKEKNGHYTITDVYSLGLFACASIPEETTILAGYLKEHAGLPWLKARDLAFEIFQTSEQLYDLPRSLKPRKGFPDILVRLREAGIPYGIATSDTFDRAKTSINLYDDFDALSFVVSPVDVERGKPFPDMLYLIQEKTGVPVEKMGMVGDLLVDVRMAKAAGAVGIGVPEYEDMAQAMEGYATEIVPDLDEIRFV